MKKQSVLYPALVVIAAMSAASTQANLVSDPDIFDATTTATANSTFNGSFNADFLVDGGHIQSSHVFGDGMGNDQRISLSGFNSQIDSLRFFDEPTFSERIAIDVTIYFSVNDHSGQSEAFQLDTANYGPGTFYDLPSIAVVNDLNTEDYFQIPTSPNQFSDPFGSGPSSRAIHFAELTGLGIPAGTQSLLLQFTPSSIFTGQGAGLTEIQGFAIPEPSSLALILSAAVAGVILRRRVLR